MAEADTKAADLQTGEDSEESGDEKTKNGDVYILFTSDVHCGVDQGFGYAGLKQVRDKLEADGYETLLVDDGDSIQGEQIGIVSKGEDIIDLMNGMQYDVAIPGNHEFDYGMEQFLNLTEKAQFPYISCNFTHLNELVFKPYVICEKAGKKIAFVGVITPETIRSSTPVYFQDDKGKYIYGFMEDKTGERLYECVQKAVDDARKEGADYVYLVGHLGNSASSQPWTYADVISHTYGIDVVLDGHSHDTDQVVMKNKDGKEVVRSAVGTKMSCIGYSHISSEGEIVETSIWTWTNNTSAPELLNIKNDIADQIALKKKELGKKMNKVVASSSVEMTINDPEAVDSYGEPVRMIRRGETNLGDFCADAYRDQTGAQIAFVNGGGIRANIEKGDITYGDIINVNPFSSNLCVIEVTGQQILDALEWGCRAVPDESGGFLQVSGLTYEKHSEIDTPCKTDEKSMCAEIRGERRAKNVRVGDQPIDPDRTYTLASIDYILLNNGDGFTMFDGATLVQNMIKADNQALIDYITGTMGGKAGEEYADPYGQGRIIISE